MGCIRYITKLFLQAYPSVKLQDRNLILKCWLINMKIDFKASGKATQFGDKDTGKNLKGNNQFQ